MNSVCSHLRALTRIAVLCIVTTFFYLLWACTMPLLLVSEKASYWWRSLNFQTWAKLTSVLFGMRVGARGTPPQAPFFLVSNHLSYMDIVAFASKLDCVFIAKNEVAKWPVLGLLCRSMGTIFVDRNSRLDVPRVNRLIEEELRSGKGLLLFPEGTSSRGAEVLPFHSALLEPAVRGGSPVSFATVSYRTPVGQAPAHQSVCWWGEMPFLPHFYRLLQLKSLEATLGFGSHSIRADDRKLLARKLWQAVKEDFIAVVETDSPLIEGAAPKSVSENPLGGSGPGTHARCASVRHSRESGNPAWIPARAALGRNDDG
ncbi:MAG: 1-acyl-sn-glycerol-3-phosphate acyltransferase, partial [Acidobacteria bacterium]|nr:1-acyl-sn-glycerol-3-phosphate acyltransferase [Acidobacteriota bacterium]